MINFFSKNLLYTPQTVQGLPKLTKNDKHSHLHFLALFFIIGASIRLLHAWHTFRINDNIWPAGGVPDYLEEANPKQTLVTIHISFCSTWALILFRQFRTGLANETKGKKKMMMKSHKTFGYIGVVIGAIAAASGWLLVWTLAIPSYVGAFIKTQLLVGALGFLTEAILGIFVLVKDRDLVVQRKHMTLSLVGTIADAGNGFSISFTRCCLLVLLANSGLKM